MVIVYISLARICSPPQNKKVSKKTQKKKQRKKIFCSWRSGPEKKLYFFPLHKQNIINFLEKLFSNNKMLDYDVLLNC